MKRILSSLVLALACTIAFSQNDQRIAKSKTPLSDIQQVVMPLQDNAALLEAEMQRREPGIAPQFAVNLETDISPNTHGQWERLTNGQALWRLRIFSKDAKSLNLGFTKYNMPRGGSLIIYSPGQERVMGPFTPADNEEHEQLWTPVLEDEELVIEVKIPVESKDELELELKYVNHDFAGFSEMASGSCNLDVICGAADGWEIVDKYRDIIQSVAVYSVGGSLSCTGFLVNNARQDCTPYFMTANHCGVGSNNASSLVAYWNFENSTCRQPNSPASGGNGNGQLNDSNSGSIWRASWAPSDFTLVEFDDPVSETANGFFAGWSAEFVMPQDTIISIHHPNLEEKRISFEFDPAQPGNGLNGNIVSISNADHVIIPDWDIGTTEPGSSGSPLFNNQRKVVGQLHGGNAACGNDAYDTYGWFNSSWEGGGTPNTRLKDWLDPDDSGITEMDGRAVMQCNFFVDASPASQEICAATDVLYTINVSDNFQNDVDLTINNLPMGLVATFGANPVAPGGTTDLTITNTGSLSAGVFSFSVSGTDGVESNNTDLTLFVVAGLPPVPDLNSPVDQEVGVVTFPTFSWSSVANTSYTIEIATDADFTTIIETANGITGSQYQVSSSLSITQEYFWRVKGENLCGENDWSAVHSFTTAAILCALTPSTDLPVVIPQNGMPIVSSTLEIQNGGTISDVNVHNIEIAHTWVSDLRIELTSPEGTTIQLMNNVFGGECQGDNLAISFDDQAANSYAMLDAMCNITDPALEGTFQPSAALSNFAGEESAGPWTLRVFDDVNQDGGSITNWELELCTAIPNDQSVTPSEDEITTCIDASSSFSITLGNGFADSIGISLSANNLPMGAIATFDPNPAMPSSQVMVTLSGATEIGDFDIDIIADDGMLTGQGQVQWKVNGPSLGVPQLNFTTCNVSTILVPINVGECAGANGIDLTISGLPMNATAVFSSNPVFSNENPSVDITLNIVAPGNYPITINGDDGVNNVSASFNLIVEGPASTTNLLVPSDGEIDVDIEPTLTWDAAPDAIDYKFEIATDVDFNNIVFETTQPQTAIALPSMLDYLTLYYWRITSFNDCGGSTTAPFSFTTEMANAVVEIDGFQLEILPNPTSGILQINSSVPLIENIDIKVFSINGIELLEAKIGKGFSQTIVDLTGYPSGIYLLQLATGNEIKTEQIVLE